MTSEQRRKVLAVIDKDCEIAGWYADDEGKTCFIGGLLLEAGITLDSLRKNRDNTVHKIPQKHQELLAKEYGLSPDAARSLQRANDSWVGGPEWSAQRRASVRSTLLVLFPEVAETAAP